MSFLGQLGKGMLSYHSGLELDGDRIRHVYDIILSFPGNPDYIALHVQTYLLKLHPGWRIPFHKSSSMCSPSCATGMPPPSRNVFSPLLLVMTTLGTGIMGRPMVAKALLMGAVVEGAITGWILLAGIIRAMTERAILASVLLDKIVTEDHGPDPLRQGW